MPFERCDLAGIVMGIADLVAEFIDGVEMRSVAQVEVGWGAGDELVDRHRSTLPVVMEVAGGRPHGLGGRQAVGSPQLALAQSAHR